MNQYIDFCDECGEYITDNGTCSNPWCPEPVPEGCNEEDSEYDCTNNILP